MGVTLETAGAPMQGTHKRGRGRSWLRSCIREGTVFVERLAAALVLTGPDRSVARKNGNGKGCLRAMETHWLLGRAPIALELVVEWSRDHTQTSRVEVLMATQAFDCFGFPCY